MTGDLMRCRLALLFLPLLLSGCATDSAQELRMERYTPLMSGRNIRAWEQAGEEGVTRADGLKTPSPGDTNLTSSFGPTRKLKRGDRVGIYLRGIPSPEEFNEVIDDLGSVSLPLVGTLRIEGMSTTEAERTIRDAYVGNGYYSKITISVLPQDAEYFVRGEVKREGRYPLAGDLTLGQALISAGGFTDFANIKKIKINRGDDDSTTHNYRRIETHREPDPPIRPGDIIVVPRRWF